MTLTAQEARSIAKTKKTRWLKRYVAIAGRVWPDDVRVAAARDELAYRQAIEDRKAEVDRRIQESRAGQPPPTIS